MESFFKFQVFVDHLSPYRSECAGGVPESDGGVLGLEWFAQQQQAAASDDFQLQPPLTRRTWPPGRESQD